MNGVAIAAAGLGTGLMRVIGLVHAGTTIAAPDCFDFKEWAAAGVSFGFMVMPAIKSVAIKESFNSMYWAAAVGEGFSY
jgi:hypothetical protein